MFVVNLRLGIHYRSESEVGIFTKIMYLLGRYLYQC